MLQSLILPLILTALSLISISQVLKIKSQTRLARIEAEVPSIARRFASLLESGMGFSEALNSLASGNSPLAQEMARITLEIKRGISVPIALQNSASRIESEDYRKFINQLVLIYKSGEGHGQLKNLARDMLRSRTMDLKRYGGKAVMYSLMLVSLSSTVPAMFLAYLTIGSLFMKINISPLEALLVPSLLFPAIDVFLILMIHTRKPRFMWYR